MISTNEFRPGMTIELDGQAYLVLDSDHHKLVGRGGAVVRTRLRNLETGVIVDKTFNAGEKVPKAHVEERQVQYLYAAGDEYYVMDLETYEQFHLTANEVGGNARFLKENMVLSVSLHKGKAVSVSLPITVELQVTETEPGFRGDTAAGGSKPATLETGAVIKVPLFVNNGDVIKVDTRAGEYIGRA